MFFDSLSYNDGEVSPYVLQIEFLNIFDWNQTTVFFILYNEFWLPLNKEYWIWKEELASLDFFIRWDEFVYQPNELLLFS